MVLVKRSPSLPNYKGPISSEILEEHFEERRESPLLYVKESNNSYEIEIDVPGLANKNFHIKVDDGAMIISSEILKADEEPVEGKLKLSIMKKAGNSMENNTEKAVPNRPFQFTVL